MALQNARAKLERLTKLKPQDPDFAIFKAGQEYGAQEATNKALQFLQDKYLGDDAPDRGTPEAKAILKLAGELSNELNRA